MNLFTIKQPVSITVADNLLVETPLGNLVFELFFTGGSTLLNKPKESKFISSKAVLFSWEFKECLVEFLQVNFVPNIPFGMNVDRCIGGIWRVKSLSEKTSFKFCCRLKSQIKPFPEPGEGLITQSFESDMIKLTIGTEDEELLQSRAIKNNNFPSHFQNKINPDTIEYLVDGIQITLPECQCDDLIQTHFIIAWSSKSNDDISTWYAVDQPVNEILQQAGVE